MKSFLDFEEKNVEKAVQKACADLKVARDKLKYDIISHGSSGIFGLVGAKKALIRVFVPEQKNNRPASGSSPAADTENKFQTVDTAQSDKDSVNALVDEAFGKIAEPEPKPKKESKPAKEPKPVKAKEKPKPKPKSKPKTAPKAEKTEPPATNEITTDAIPAEAVKEEKPAKDKHPVESEAVQTAEAALAAADDENTIDNEKAIAVARDLATEIFKTMAIDAELSVNINASQCWINVKVEEPGILIGKRGQTLEAIQYLADKVVNKQCGKGNRVIFDVEGYVESRKTELKDLAARLASKAVKTGKPSTMTRMNAHDRRVVHISLKKNRSVRTQSVGDGYYRKLIIFPKKKSSKKTDKVRSQKETT